MKIIFCFHCLLGPGWNIPARSCCSVLVFCLHELYHPMEPNCQNQQQQQVRTSLSLRGWEWVWEGASAAIVWDIFQDFDPSSVLLVLPDDLCIRSPCDWCCALYFLLLTWEVHRIPLGEVEKLGMSPPAWAASSPRPRNCHCGSPV